MNKKKKSWMKQMWHYSSLNCKIDSWIGWLIDGLKCWRWASTGVETLKWRSLNGLTRLKRD